MFTLFFCHWYVNGAVPVAVTVNVAVCPDTTDRFDGWLAIDGGAVTLSIPVVLVSFPALLLTMHRNREPLSAIVVTGVVYEAAVAPPIFMLFFCH